MSLSTSHIDTSAKNLRNLKRKVNSLSEKINGFDVTQLNALLKEHTNDSKDVNIRLEAAKAIQERLCSEARNTLDEITTLLDNLKIQSYPLYLDGFKCTYDTLINFCYDGNMKTEIPEEYLSNTNKNNPGLFEVVSIMISLQFIELPYARRMLKERAKDYDTVYTLPESFKDLKEYILQGLYSAEEVVNGYRNILMYHNIPRALDKFNSLRFQEENPKHSFALLDKYIEVIDRLVPSMEESEYVYDEFMKLEALAMMYEEMKDIPNYAHLLFTPDENEALTKVRSDVLQILNVQAFDEDSNDNSSLSEFDSAITPDNAAFLLQMLEDMGITVNGKANLSERKKGALRGVIEAAREKNVLPLKSINYLCVIVADKIGLQLKSKLDFSSISLEYQKKAAKYIADNYNLV